MVHGRDGEPEWALLVCDLADGTRTYAQVRDPELCADAETTELVGRTVTPDAADRRRPDGQTRTAVEPIADLVTTRDAA